MSLLRHLDLVLLALGLPVFAIAGLPLLGWATAAGIWLAWRGIGIITDRKAAESDDPRTVAGLAAGSMIGRGWLLGLVLVGIGIGAGDDVGLSAAVFLVLLFTIHFTFKLALRPADLPGPAGPAGRTRPT